MEMYDSHAISTTEVVTAVIEPRLIDTASESVGWLSSPIVYTIENPTDTVQVEEWITSKLTLTTVTMASGDQAMMTKRRHSLDKPRHGSGRIRTTVATELAAHQDYSSIYSTVCLNGRREGPLELFNGSSL